MKAPLFVFICECGVSDAYLHGMPQFIYAANNGLETFAHT